MEEIAAKNKEVYDQYGDALAAKYANTFPHRVKEHAKRFMHALHGKTILDVGCGPGTHAEFFNRIGLDVTCVDVSETMLKKCESKGLKTLLVDLQEMQFPDRTIDGIWAVSSIIHIRKQNLPAVIKKWHRMLRPEGMVFIAVKEGEKEGFECTKELPQAPRWFAYFSDEEVRRLVAPFFEIVFYSREPTETGTVYLNYLMRKK